MAIRVSVVDDRSGEERDLPQSWIADMWHPSGADPWILLTVEVGCAFGTTELHICRFEDADTETQLDVWDEGGSRVATFDCPKLVTYPSEDPWSVVQHEAMKRCLHGLCCVVSLMGVDDLARAFPKAGRR